MKTKQCLEKLLIVTSTIESDIEGVRLGRELVSSRLAACVQCLPGLTSIYQWEGSIQESRECLLIMKTTPGKLKELRQKFLELHPYDTPQFVVCESKSSSEGYMNWVLGSLAE